MGVESELWGKKIGALGSFQLLTSGTHTSSSLPELPKFRGRRKMTGFQQRNGICYKSKVSVQVFLAELGLLRSRPLGLTGGA